ncbi:Hypothetical predicted protein [Marmota monax]|uniref:Uncharacterized protein n=1 Tax=Marmota monax TaxID=9995 RepID=A0A5E4CTJ9_MARMO|nr:Hypothetical predicted protein [Marmota monax]
MHNAAARRLMMFIQTYYTDGTGPTFRTERKEDEEGARPARPSPAAFLRCNLDLTPASLARRSRGRPAGAGRGDAPPVPASPLACRRGLPEAPTAPPRARTHSPEMYRQVAAPGQPWLWKYFKCLELLFDRRGAGHGDGEQQGLCTEMWRCIRGGPPLARGRAENWRLPGLWPS